MVPWHLVLAVQPQLRPGPAVPFLGRVAPSVASAVVWSPALAVSFCREPAVQLPALAVS